MREGPEGSAAILERLERAGDPALDLEAHLARRLYRLRERLFQLGGVSAFDDAQRFAGERAADGSAAWSPSGQEREARSGCFHVIESKAWLGVALRAGGSLAAAPRFSERDAGVNP